MLSLNDYAQTFLYVHSRRKIPQLSVTSNLKSVEKGSAKFGQRPELLLVVHCQRVSRNDLLRLAVHYGREVIGRWLRSDTQSGVVPFEQIPDETCFA